MSEVKNLNQNNKDNQVNQDTQVSSKAYDAAIYVASSLGAGVSYLTGKTVEYGPVVLGYVGSSIKAGAIYGAEKTLEYGPIVLEKMVSGIVTACEVGYQIGVEYGPVVGDYISQGIDTSCKFLYDVFAVPSEQERILDAAQAVNGKVLGYASYYYTQAAKKVVHTIENYDSEIAALKEAAANTFDVATENAVEFSDQVYDAGVEAFDSASELLNSTDYESPDLMNDVVADF